MGISFAVPPDNGQGPNTGTSGSSSDTVHRTAGLALTSLDESVQQFYAAGLAPSTKAVYKAGQQNSLSFALSMTLKMCCQLAKSFMLLRSVLGQGGASLQYHQGIPLRPKEFTDYIWLCKSI